MSQYNQQAQVYVHQYQGGSPNYQAHPPPNTAIYTPVHNNIPSNPNFDIYSQPQQQFIPQETFMPQIPTQPYYIPSPAGGGMASGRGGQTDDQRVPDSGSSNTLSTSSDQMGMVASPALLPSYGMNPQIEKPMLNSMPRLVINEQPKSAFRFRYNCEGSSHGALLGAKSEKGRKSYPSVYIDKYFGCAVVVASLVPAKTDEPHPFSLTGRGVNNGLFIAEIRDGTKQGTEVRLKDLSILHVKKQEVQTALLHKYAVETFIKQHGIYGYMNQCDWHSKNVNPGDDEHDETQKSIGASFLKRMRNDEKKSLKERAQKGCDQQQLTTVRLCFRAYLFNPQGQMVHEIGPTFSCTITDTKNCPSLKVCKIDKCVGSVSGNETIYLLCDKVSRDDIDVVFEEEREGQLLWTAKGEFQPSEVHHQVAIVFNTPPYKGPTNSESIQCCIKLRKPSTHEESNAVTFTYLPDEMTKAYIGNKRKRMISEAPYLAKQPQAGLQYNTQATFDPNLQLISAATLNIGEEFISDPSNIQTSLILSDNAVLSTFPDFLNMNGLSCEMNDLIGPDMNGFPDKDTTVSMLSDRDTRCYTQTADLDRAHFNIVERDGPKPRMDVVERDGPKPRMDVVERDGPKPKSTVVEKDGPKSTVIEKDGPKSTVVEKDGPKSTVVEKDGPKSTVIEKDGPKSTVVEKDGPKSTVVEKDGPKSTVVEKDGPKSTVVEKDGPKSTVVEKDGPPALPKHEKEIVSKSSEKGESLQKSAAEEVVTEKKGGEGKEEKRTKKGRNPLHVARDMGQCAQRMMNREYQAVQKYAHTGDVRNLLQPLIPYFYLHEHSRSDTLLHTALVSEQMAALKSMLSLLRVNKQHAKTVVNITNSYKHTPLHLAVSLDFTDAVRDLLAAGADPFKFDIYGNTCFHMAASRGHAACLSLLVDYISKFNGSERSEPYELCADVYNFEGKTPLHLSIEHENWAQCCDLLLKGGADLNAEERLEGLTLLHYSVMRGLLPLACYLLSDHAKAIDVDATTHSGDTPLYLALVNRRLSIASTLIRSGASVDIPNADGRTAEEVCEERAELRGFIRECRSARATPVHASDLYKLREEHVSDLGKQLSEGKWRLLAAQLKIDSEQFAASKDEATKLLLRSYEGNGGTISGLIRACENIDCTEGVNILKKLT